MSTIRSSTSLSHQASGLQASGTQSRVSNEAGFSTSVIGVGTDDEEITLGEIITPQQIAISLLSGSPVQVGLDGSTYPFLLGAAGASALFPLAVTREISAIVAEADAAASLSSKYFVLTDRAGTVWVWLDTGEFATVTLTMDTQPSNGDTLTIGSRTYTWQSTLTNADGNIWIGADLAAAKLNLGYAIADSGGTPGTDYAAAMTANTEVSLAAFASDAAVFTALAAGTAANAFASTETFTAGTNVFSGTTMSGGLAASVAPAGSPNRKLQVTIPPNATASAVATALQVALNADAEFIASVSGATVTVTDAHTGTRTDAADGDTGWGSITTTQQGAASPVIHLKSVSASEVLVAVAPQ